MVDSTKQIDGPPQSMPDKVNSQDQDDPDMYREHFELNGLVAHPYPMSSIEVIVGIGTVFGWIMFFAGGAVVGTADARQIIAQGKFDSFAHALQVWFTVITCYTITNVASLSCLAGMAGQFSSRSRESELTVASGRNRIAPPFKDLLACYAAAAMRGFVLYLLIVSGLLMVTTEAMAKPDQNQYVRLAGMMSVVSFVAGYDSLVFKQALERIVALISQADRKAPQAASSVDSQSANRGGKA